ncbi:hypothetical protein OR263_27540 [Streptomyces sp. NEAU-H22]|uniref:hypothetical protein n=1 Tax=Streptomyces sp. NEAU-H22 TaxID=2994655 RepID=UPI0022590355|nr:hypothetical protein [Streptomyces sp. NEAU-H22]MCX3290420.1 hypothetical protein [Streptomyces sp. NEAU-H22]
MLDALRFEWTRLRTLRSTYWMVGSGLVASAVIPLVLGLGASDEPLHADAVNLSVNGGASFVIPFLAVFMAVVGIFATGHEYRHGTIQPTLTALPQRSRLLLAKILTVTALTAVATLVSIAINATLVLVFWGEVPGLFDDPVRSALLGYLAYNLIYALTGLGLGLLFRGVPSALVVIFLMPLIIETLIVGLTMVPALQWLAPAVKFLPFTAGEELMLTSPANFGPAAPDIDFFDRWASGGVFAAFAALIIGASWIQFKKRDA